MTDLQVIRPAGHVWRIGRMPDPWAWPPWEAQHADNTFGNRWDDPEGVYRVVYACSQLEGAYVEVLSRLRPDPAVLAGLAEIDGPDPEYRVGIVPGSWLATRAVGEATIRGDYADIGHAASLTYLRAVMAGRLIHYGIGDLDAAAIRLSALRRFNVRLHKSLPQHALLGGAGEVCRAAAGTSRRSEQEQASVPARAGRGSSVRSAVVI